MITLTINEDIAREIDEHEKLWIDIARMEDGIKKDNMIEDATVFAASILDEIIRLNKEVLSKYSS